MEISNGAFFTGHLRGRFLPEDACILFRHRLIIPTSDDMTTTCPQGKDMEVFFSGRPGERDPLPAHFYDGAGFRIALVEIPKIRELYDQDSGCVLAWLSEDEQEYISRFRFPKRYSEWLGGRVAVKAALLRDRTFLQEKCDLCEITVLADTHGRPVIMQPQSVKMARISISHSGRYGVGMASFCGCGVDIQQIESRIAKLGDHIGTEREIRMATEAVGSLQEGLTLLWAAKEAVKKCCLYDRPGLFRASLVERICPKKGNGRKILCRLVESGRRQNVQVAHVGDYMLAWCWRERDAGTTRG